jgi:predicted ATPase/class 3 adenylate cyclase
MDWRQAIARGETLPEWADGAALFADISGFTPLTEALALELGPKRGAEELTVHLNRVYDALIAELHRYGGSVIGFAGDAITCWLHGDDGRRAVACGLAMQEAMRAFAEIRTHSGRIVSLGMKAAAATGSVRRFLVGDPEYVIVDAMAGKTLEYMAAAEHQAERGEMVLHGPAAEALGDALTVTEWRTDEETGERFAVVGGLHVAVPERPWPEMVEDALTDEQRRGWLLPPVHQRLNSGRGEFLAELRPAVALFLKFSGIHYDDDPAAPQKLDAFIRRVEQILLRYDGSLIQLTIGDKGSYLYAAFGAPIAHEDDAVRAASTALELQALAAELAYLDQVQIGLTQGRMRTGAYGSQTRRTYGVLGDATNLSARLMAVAQPGQILVSRIVRDAADQLFNWERLPNIRVRGKTDLVTLFRLDRARQGQTLQRFEPKYRLPMIGRGQELALIGDKLDQALKGNGQIIGLTAEAGMGKSRLAAEAVRLAQDHQLETYGGECQSYGTNTSYLVWQPIWRSFFGLDSNWTVAQQVQVLEEQLAQIDPTLLPRLPLLGAVLNITIPDSELTSTFDAKLRKSSLESLLVDCLRARTRTTPLLILLEDCHWLDPLSHDLIEVLGRSIGNLPVMFILGYRSPDLQRSQAPRLSNLPHFTEIELKDFTAEESEQLIRLKLQQYLGEEATVPAEFAEMVIQRATGNPFYIEEILNYLQDLGIDPQNTEQLADLDLPTSIYSLILSRIDQLNEHQQITLKVASVIGRFFRAAMIWGVYPDLGELGGVEADLQALSAADLTALDTPEPEFVYLFKHVVTQEVAYESLPYATRSNLHEQIAFFIEANYANKLDQYLDLLALHFDRSENVPKKRHYLREAGEAAQSRYANAVAIDYFQRLLPLLEPGERSEVLFNLGQVLDTVGDYDEAEASFREALSLSEQHDEQQLRVRCLVAIGELRRNQSQYDEAKEWYDQAQALAEQIGDESSLAKALVCAGSLALYQGHFQDALTNYQQSLILRRKLNDQPNVANLLNNLAITAANQGDLDRAQELFAESLAIRREVGDKWAIANSLNNLGELANILGAFEQARVHLEEAVAVYRELGDKWMLGNASLNLGNVARALGTFAEARKLYNESLQINRDLGDRWMLAHLLEGIGGLLAMRGEAEPALQLTAAAVTLRETIGTPSSETEQTKLNELLAPARQALGPEVAAAAWESGRAMALEQALALALNSAAGDQDALERSSEG